MLNDLVKNKVLIVDDSEMNRSILSDILGDEYDILEARDGLEAIDILSKEGDNISLMLLDIVMPRMDGFLVLSKMNENHWIQNIPVIIISSENASLYVERAYDLGALDYIQRPFDTLVVRRRSQNTISLYGRQRAALSSDESQLAKNLQSQSTVINLLTNLIERGRIDFGSHAENVREISEAILNNLGGISFKYKLSAEDIANISIASYLRDIGMFSLDKSLLESDSEEDIKKVRSHTVLGAEMLSKLSDSETDPLLKRAVEICQSHHERWDGKGYPEGLKGDRIPISAQVVAVAETYDMLTNKSINENALTHDEAVAKIMNGECGAFNPVLMIVLKTIADTLPAKLK